MGNKARKHCVDDEEGTPWRQSPPSQSLSAKASFSNPSLVAETSSSTLPVMQRTSFLEQLDENHMQEMYTSFKDMNIDTRGTFDRDLLTIAINAIEALTNDTDIINNVNAFVNRFYFKDDHFVLTFAECARKNPILVHAYHSYATGYRIMVHMVFVFRFLKYILEMFKDGRLDEAYELMNLTALAHMVMNLSPEKIRIQTVKVLKFLVHFSLVTTEHFPVLVYYTYLITDYICDAMKSYKMNNTAAHMQNFSENDSLSRENYRKLKKWKIGIHEMQKQMTVPLEQLEAQFSEGSRRPILVKWNSEEEERWKILTCLKKGYRYRQRARSNLLDFKHWMLND